MINKISYIFITGINKKIQQKSTFINQLWKVLIQEDGLSLQSLIRTKLALSP